MLSLCTSATDTIVALGDADRLLRIDEFSRVVPGIERRGRGRQGQRGLPGAGGGAGIDLAFIWWYQDDAAAMLEDLAVPVVRIRSGRAAELPAMIRLVGDCLDCREAAERAAAHRVVPRQAAARPRQNAKRVFLELYGPFKTVGRDTYTNDLLELAGGRNVAADAKGTVLFSAERLVQADPDVILFVGTASDRRRWFAARHVRSEGGPQRRVFALDRYWLVAGPGCPSPSRRFVRPLLDQPTP